MKTNEEIKRDWLAQAESALERVLEEREEMKDGDLEHLEQRVFQTMLDLGRQGMELMLNAEAKKEAKRERPEGTCGHALRLVGHRKRQVVTLMGQITISRAYYHCEERKRSAGGARLEPPCPGRVPFDEQWGLTASQASPGVQKLLARLAARLTFEEVAETVGELVPVTTSARQVAQLIQPIGQAFVRREEEQISHLLQQGADKHLSLSQKQEEQGPRLPRVYVELDGVMARLRRGSVPMETAEKERAGDVYREVKVGAVCIAEPGPERSHLVPGVFVDTLGPKQYVAARTTAEDFGPRVYALARQNGLLRAEQVVVLADGARWIWKLAEDQFPGAIQIVDEYHARQHVWEVARAAFSSQLDLRDSWAQHVIDLLSQGRVEEVIAAIEKLPALAPEPGKTHSVPETEAEYFRTNRQRMRYPVFRAQGMHLGSGVAEAACKTVVSTRAKRSGMRWTPKGLAAILALRTAVLNRQFDLGWQACCRSVQ